MRVVRSLASNCSEFPHMHRRGQDRELLPLNARPVTPRALLLWSDAGTRTVHQHLIPPNKSCQRPGAGALEVIDVTAMTAAQQRQIAWAKGAADCVEPMKRVRCDDGIR